MSRGSHIFETGRASAFFDLSRAHFAIKIGASHRQKNSSMYHMFFIYFVYFSRPLHKQLQCLAKKLDFLGFSIQNDPRCYGRKPLKSYVKSTIFFSIACTNVESFSMSFGCKIFSGSGNSSCQIFNIHFSLLKLTFFGTFKFEGL